MSIAASVVVKPSRLLLTMVGAMCMGVALIGVLLGFGMIGELPVWQRALYAATCILLAPVGFIHTVRTRKTYCLDISGSGQIRLDAVKAYSADECHGLGGSLVVLQHDSTIWPRFLLLRLRAEDGRIHVLPILPDCLPAESLRAVAVACRWIASHNLPHNLNL